MRIQRIQAADMQTALEQVRGRLGPDAVIISTRGLGSTSEERRRGLTGIEVVAGVEPEKPTTAAKPVPVNNVAAAAARAAYGTTVKETPPSPAPSVGSDGAANKSRTKRTASLGIPLSVTSAAGISTPRFPRVDRFGDPIPEPEPDVFEDRDITANAPVSVDEPDDDIVLRNLRRLAESARPADVAPAPAPVVNYVPAPQPITAATSHGNAAPRANEEPMTEGQATDSSRRQTAAHCAAEHVYQLLLSAGLVESVAESALEQAISIMPASALGDSGRLLEVTLSRLIAGLPSEPSLTETSLAGKTVFFVGAAGAGKTTALLKAARHLRSSGAAVRIVAADVSRLGATEHLQRYGELLGLPVEIAYTAEDAAQIFAGLDANEVALIDTAACRLGAAVEQVDQDLLDLLSLAENRVVVLTAPAGAGEADLHRLAVTARALKADALALTRMDEAWDPRVDTVSPIGSALNVTALLRLPPLFNAGGRDILEAVSTTGAVEMAVQALETVTAIAGPDTDR